MTAISYDKQTLNAVNPIARFSHRSRFTRALHYLNVYTPDRGTVVDFGAGPGAMLSMLGNTRADIKLYAIEPAMPPSIDKRINYIDRLDQVPGKADVISAFECCEHLLDQDLEAFLVDASNALKDGGRLIISVPIMLGLALPFKILNRAFLLRHDPEYSWRETLAGILGRKVQRSKNPMYSHKGFDFRTLKEKVSEKFTIEKEAVSPFYLPWWLNSQIFIVCSKRTELSKAQSCSPRDIQKSETSRA